MIDHISEYLRHYYEETVRKEEAAKPAIPPSFTAHNSTVVIGSQVGGDISNKMSITESQKSDANELINAIRDALAASDSPNKDDIEDILLQVKEETDKDRKPRKGLLTALKVLCQAGSVAIPFVTALMELFA